MLEHLVPTAAGATGAIGAFAGASTDDVFDFVMKGSGIGSPGSPAATGGTGGYATRNKAHAPGGNTHGAGSHTQTKAKENKRNNKGQTTVAPPEASAATGEGNNDNGSYPHAPPQFPNAMFAMHVPPFADTNIAPMSYNNVGPAMPSGGYAPVTTNTAAGGMLPPINALSPRTFSGNMDDILLPSGPFPTDATVPSHNQDPLRVFDINASGGGMPLPYGSTLFDGPTTTGYLGDSLLPGMMPVGMGMATDPLLLKADVLADLASSRPRTPSMQPGSASANVAAAIAQAEPSVIATETRSRRSRGGAGAAAAAATGAGDDPMDLSGPHDRKEAAGGSSARDASGSKRKAADLDRMKSDAAAATAAANSPADMDDEEDGTELQDGEGEVVDEKERKRLKRLLRNRVSAQQARERKKCYVGNLEARVKELESNVGSLEMKVKTLEREKFMLLELLKREDPPA